MIRASVCHGTRSTRPSQDRQTRTLGRALGFLKVSVGSRATGVFSRLLLWTALLGQLDAAEHWAFIAPQRPVLPRVADPGACRGAIDTFVLARLEKAGRRFSPEADRYTLVRRLSLDLRGLPPTLKEVDGFLADTRPDAYAHLVDAFLADSAYGEKMASFWLDLARFGDTNGYQDDGVRTMWLYRDYVIDAFNANMPFDRFTVENLAGDLLPGATIAQQIASGFNRNHRFNEEGGSDPDEFRVVYAVDRTNTTATTWLGLTLECAQCHDHKYDPISQKEYYSFYAFFNNIEGELGVSKARKQPPFLELPTPAESARREALTAQRKELEELAEQTRSTVDARFESWLDAAELRQDEEREAAGDAELMAILAKDNGERTDEERRRLRRFYVKLREPGETERAERLGAVKKELRALERGIVATMVMQEKMPRRPTFVLERGDFRSLGEEVSPGVPAIFPRLDSATPDRVALARSFTDPSHPLVARVLVNRLWYQVFGRGLVSTPNDFGVRSAPPSHPYLLDWLATEAVRLGWDVKAIQRLIVTSSTYRQASVVRDVEDADPENRLLGRASRYRLRAEDIRDNALAIGGLLSRKMGGASVMPEQPEGYFADKSRDWHWRTSPGAEQHRRALYTFWRRTTPYPSLLAFDAPSRELCVARREQTTTAQQALVTLNDPVFFGAARALAERIVREGPPSNDAKIDLALRLAVARPPRLEERAVLKRLLYAEELRYRSGEDALDASGAASGEAATRSATDAAQLAAWTSVANAILNLDEVICRE